VPGVLQRLGQVHAHDDERLLEALVRVWNALGSGCMVLATKREPGGGWLLRAFPAHEPRPNVRAQRRQAVWSAPSLIHTPS